jgi:hypothetical protein
MNHSTYIAAALASVPTIVTVLIGIVLSQRQFDGLDARMSAIESCMDSIEATFSCIERNIQRH